MSDYRRWISYIYAYENGVKKKNAGYAKLELKDGKLAMTLHITPDGREGNLQICMYKCHAGSREGVLFGSIEKKQGGEGIQFLEDASNLRGSGLLFQEMNGLLLYDDNRKYLISSWEDEPIDIAALQEIVAYLEKGKPAQEKMEEERKMENAVKKEKEEIHKEQVGEEIKQIGLAIPKNGRSMTASMEETGKEEENKERNDSPVQSESGDGIHMAEVSSAKAEQQEESAVVLPETEESAIIKEKPEKNAFPPPGKLESRVFSCLPAMYPFEHQEFERSVRMEPQDIGLLPREMWKYAGNSFLLHSYYAYHHILFVRKLRKEQRNCYLMLPGVFNPKEQHMAQLFGFCDFCPVRKKILQQGDFGYWYMEVVFPNDTP